MKIKDLVDLKGCYSAYDVGELDVPETQKDKEISELVEALGELYAQVKGECPSLLNEDSGGDAILDYKIEQALNKYKTINE